jgi:hypothetical protein
MDQKYPGFNANAIRELAEAELRAERFRQAVDTEKQRLQQARWWHRFIPFRLTITRRK